MNDQSEALPALDGAGKGATQPVSVLLADDHRMVRAGLAALIGAVPGLRIVGAACDGQQAVDMALAHRPQVVLMDLSMPVMDGVEATRRIIAELPGTRVVMLSAVAPEHRGAEAAAAGVYAYLVKNADPHIVVATVWAAARGDLQPAR